MHLPRRDRKLLQDLVKQKAISATQAQRITVEAEGGGREVRDILKGLGVKPARDQGDADKRIKITTRSKPKLKVSPRAPEAPAPKPKKKRAAKKAAKAAEQKAAEEKAAAQAAGLGEQMPSVSGGTVDLVLGAADGEQDFISPLDDLPSVDTPEGPKKMVGPYEVHHVLGQGGMGVVYKARHTGLDRLVALKVLIAGKDATEQAANRFIAEAKTAASLDTHPHIVRVLDAGQVQALRYMAMEFVDGPTLTKLIDEKQIEPHDAARLIAQIADALAFAHERGIIHRDIKPDNIMVNQRKQAKLNDFGIAKVKDDAHSGTMTGAVIGTLAYMPPEQAEDSKSVDARSDIYSLGAVLYAVLTGRPPHIGKTPANVMASLLGRQPPMPRELVSEIDLGLESICMKAIAREPENRYQSARELKSALTAYARGDLASLGATNPELAYATPITKKIPSLPLLGVLGILILGLVLWGGGSKKPEPPSPISQNPKGEPETPKPTKTPVTTPVTSPVTPPITTPQPPAAKSVLRLDTPRSGELFTTNAIPFSGQASPDGTRLTIDGQSTLVEGGRFYAKRTYRDGRYEVEIRFQDGIEDPAPPITVGFTVDTLSPELELDVPEFRPGQRRLTITGKVTERDLDGLTANGRKVYVESDGQFALAVAAEEYYRGLKLIAVDKAGHRTERFLAPKIEALLAVDRWSLTSYAEQDREIAIVAGFLGEAFSHTETKVYSCGRQTHRIAIFKHLKTGALLHLLPGGEYRMGTRDIEVERIELERIDREADLARLQRELRSEIPAHAVTLPPFLMGRFELSAKEWDKVQGDDSGHSLAQLLRPVQDADRAAIEAWLEKAGDGLRLPSEAEWEYACRAGTKTRYFWGDKPDDSYAWVMTNSALRPRPITAHRKKTNAFGLADMLGHVWEWCADHAIENYRSGPDDQNPRRARTDLFIRRGGSLYNDFVICRSAQRSSAKGRGLPEEPTGFRLALSIPGLDKMR